MHSKQFKYKQFLKIYSDCPPDNYKEIDIPMFRWISLISKENFVPMNLQKEPPQRILDNSDTMCKGYGLSMFNSFDAGKSRYKSLYKKKRGVTHNDFVLEKGDAIAELKMNGAEGIYGNLNIKNGHFTFYEFIQTDLQTKIIKTIKIFDNNGNFK